MKKKKSKPINALAEPKTRKELLSYKPPTIPETRDSVKSRIDEIIKGEYPSRPEELANVYLNRKEAFPLPLQVRIKEFEEFMKKGCGKLVSSGLIKPQTLETKIKPMIDDYLKCLRNDLSKALEEMRGKISKNTMEKLERNYDKKTVDSIIAALVDFKPYLEPSDRLDLKKIKKDTDNIEKLLRWVISTEDFLLRRSCFLDDSERGAHRKTKTYHEVLLKAHLTRKRIALGPVKEALLKHSADATILSGKGEGWTEEYFRQCMMGEYIFTKPHVRPMKLFPKALEVVIFRLLENNNKQIKQMRKITNGWRYKLTADIINQCFKEYLDKELTPKDINNALHSS